MNACSTTLSVYPAYAGVILVNAYIVSVFDGLPRVCGGDPGRVKTQKGKQAVYPAYAGVIPFGTS